MLLTLGVIAYQDIKDRLVWWFLFPAYATLGGFLYFRTTLDSVFLYSILINIMLVISILGIIWLYSKFVLRKNFLNEVFGLGDVLLLFAFSLAFPTLSFITFFVFSIFFSLLIQLVLKSVRKEPSVPLAGYMAIFIIGIYIASWSGLHSTMYLL